MRILERFDGTVQSRGKNGTTPLRLVLRDWIVRNNTRLDPFPERGFLVMQLRAGELVTIIDGKRANRQTDDIWSVPENAVLVIETEKDSAILQTLSVRTDAGDR